MQESGDNKTMKKIRKGKKCTLMPSLITEGFMETKQNELFKIFRSRSHL